MQEEECETEKFELHVLCHGGLQRLLENGRACVVDWMLGEDKSQLKI